jgi:hypothetical protein
MSPQCVVDDLSNGPYVEVAGARMLRRLHDELAGNTIELRVVGTHSDIREGLCFAKLQDWIGPNNHHISLEEALAIDTPPVDSQCRDETSR